MLVYYMNTSDNITDSLNNCLNCFKTVQIEIIKMCESDVINKLNSILQFSMKQNQIPDDFLKQIKETIKKFSFKEDSKNNSQISQNLNDKIKKKRQNLEDQMNHFSNECEKKYNEQSNKINELEIFISPLKTRILKYKEQIENQRHKIEEQENTIQSLNIKIMNLEDKFNNYIEAKETFKEKMINFSVEYKEEHNKQYNKINALESILSLFKDRIHEYEENIKEYDLQESFQNRIDQNTENQSKRIKTFQEEIKTFINWQEKLGEQINIFSKLYAEQQNKQYNKIHELESIIFLLKAQIQKYEDSNYEQDRNHIYHTDKQNYKMKEVQTEQNMNEKLIQDEKNKIENPSDKNENKTKKIKVIQEEMKSYIDTQESLEEKMNVFSTLYVEQHNRQCNKISELESTIHFLETRIHEYEEHEKNNDQVQENLKEQISNQNHIIEDQKNTIQNLNQKIMNLEDKVKNQRYAQENHEQ